MPRTHCSPPRRSDPRSFRPCSTAPQGYLTLVLCILRQLISWQRRAFRHSWVHGKSDKSYLKLTYKEASHSPEFILDLVRSQGRSKA